MPLRSYRDLTVWQKAMDLVLEVYSVARKLPDDEKFGLVSQLRRSAVSIAANIAEGYGRQHRGEYLQFLSIAQGSACELETLLILIARLKFVSREEVQSSWGLLQEVGKMLRGLRSSLKDS